MPDSPDSGMIFHKDHKTLHTVSYTGNQENTQHTGGELAQNHATGHSFPYAVIHLKAYSLQKGCSSLFPVWRGPPAASELVQPGSCASRRISPSHV